MVSKREVFDLFYSMQQVSRSGGGALHSKMTRNSVSSENQLKMEKQLRELNDVDLLAYFVKLRDRNPKIAPPPKPK